MATIGQLAFAAWDVFRAKAEQLRVRKPSWRELRACHERMEAELERLRRPMFVELDDGWLGVSREPKCAVICSTLADAQAKLERAMTLSPSRLAPEPEQ